MSIFLEMWIFTYPAKSTLFCASHNFTITIGSLPTAEIPSSVPSPQGVCSFLPVVGLYFIYVGVNIPSLFTNPYISS